MFIVYVNSLAFWSLGDAIKPTLHQLCLTFVDHLMEHDFYPTMNVSFVCVHVCLLGASCKVMHILQNAQCYVVQLLGVCKNERINALVSSHLHCI